MPWLPDLHTPAEDLAYFRGQIPESAGLVAISSGVVIGFVLTRDGWLDHLYVLPDYQGTGAGSELLDEAKVLVGPGLRLWAFLRNEHARDFYRRRGFIQVRRTGGQGNEEKEPDVLLQWG